MKYVSQVFEALKQLAQKYPARTVSVVVSVVVFLAARLHVVLPEESVTHAVELVLPILIGGEVIHRNVTPVHRP